MSAYSLNREGRCPSCGAILRSNGRCMACGFIRAAPHPPRIVVDGLVYDALPMGPTAAAVLALTADLPLAPVIDPSVVLCPECLQACASARGLAVHRRAKHKEPVNA